MIEIKLGTRYAKSILSLAEEKGQLEEVHRDFKMVHDICDLSRDFRNMLKSPLINAGKKQKIIDRVLEGKFASTITPEFIGIIVRKRREAYLRDIADRVMYLYDLKKNITRGQIKSATAMSESNKEKIRKIVEEEMKTNFVLEEKIDPSLIGGFTLLVGDKEFDGSLAGRLRELRKEFENNPYVKK